MEKDAPASATGLFQNKSGSEPCQRGRRLTLEFHGDEVPILQKIQYRSKQGEEPEFWELQHPTKGMIWKEVPQALSMLFVDYLIWDKSGQPGRFYFSGACRGSHAASLGNAIYSEGPIQELFVGSTGPGKPPEPQVKLVFAGGDNVHGRATIERDRQITVSKNFLPPDCVEIYWQPHGKDALSQMADLKLLARRIRRSLGLPIPQILAEGEGKPPATAPPPQVVLDGTVDTQPPKDKPALEPSIPAEPFKLSKWLAHEFSQALDILQKRTPPTGPLPKPEPKPEEKSSPPGLKPRAPESALELFPDAPKEPPPKRPPLKSARELFGVPPKTSPDEPKPPAPKPESPADRPKPQPAKTPSPDAGAGQPPADGQPKKPAAESQPAPEPEPAPEPLPLPKIDPRHFMLPETGPLWPDQAPLVELPGEEDTYQWTLKNAFEGVLIMGRTGSGKTSGSGFTLAESFIRGGFGGLVLTVKKNEAENWRRLCAHCGREKDLLVVSRGGEWKLNVLAYESQHPGRGAGLSENLTSFCRNLLRISSRSQGPQNHDQFWTNAGDQLLNSMFDLFLLAGGGITFDRLANFVSAAPTANIPATEEAWMKVPVFGGVFKRARAAIASPEDERIFGKARDYWCKIYPGLAAKTRTSITLGIYAMLDAFRGRDIPALISGETTLSPEAVMSGFIVVLDLPLKELGHTGLMVQSAWKYLFQTALERHESSRGPNRRPVFLWEDEAQYFFSEHDHHFQDTARSSRVCRVILTQNLHSFYKELGRDGLETANSVFGNLNTKIFHNNSDPQTNEWAAKHFGTEIHSRYTISLGPPPPARGFFDSLRQSMDPPGTTSVSAAEHWEYAVRPEEFNRLRTGGPENNFMVDAYITWMGLSAENQRHFTHITFAQHPNL